MARYRARDYRNLPLLSADGAELPESYQGWLDAAEQQGWPASARGLEILRIVTEPAAFSAWCKLKKISPDAKARQ